MTLSAVAKRYAEALADVVAAAGSKLRPEEAVRQVRAFEAALEASAELREALSTPAVPSGRKKAVVGRVADVLQLAPVARNFLFVLVDHRRMPLFAEIARSFELVADERLGYARAEVTAAQELSESQRQALDAALARLTGKRIRMKTAVDGALIGGVTARIGSAVYDGSVRGRLEALEKRLSAAE
jgi:F-type H+-transporting ATPase subunit delta